MSKVTKASSNDTPHFLSYFVALLPTFCFFQWPLLLVFLVVYTNYGIIALFYMAWMVYDRNTCNKGGRRSEWIRRLGLWKGVASYFPMKLVKTVDLDPSKNYLFCAHPHGAFATSAVINFSTEATEVSKLFPGIRTTFLPVEAQFVIPFHREFIQALGMASSTVESITHFLSRPEGGEAPVLCIGGVHEMLDAHPNTYDLHLSKRKGFIRLALQNGTPLVPVFTFGENELYHQLPNPKGSLIRKVQQFLIRTAGLPFLTPTHILPIKHLVTTVVGPPLAVEKIFSPTAEDIDQLHGKYVEALKQLFYANRGKYGESNRELNIL